MLGMSKSLRMFVTAIPICLYSNGVLSATNLPPTCSASNPLVREQFNKKVEDFNDMMVKNSKGDRSQSSNKGFVCAGIGVIDYGSASDGELYFFNKATGELISICGMLLYISPDGQRKCGEICPPLEWKLNKCDAKYEEFKHLK